jgi:hypothetical protein
MVKRKASVGGNGHDKATIVTARPARKPVAAKRIASSPLVARGKDLLATEAGGMATALAIGVGAALIEIELIPGLIIGAGAILLGKLFPEIGSYARPAVKGALRAGYSVTQKAREVMAEANEQVQDLVAEVKHERAQPQSARRSRTVGKTVAAGADMPVH